MTNEEMKTEKEKVVKTKKTTPKPKPAKSTKAKAPEKAENKVEIVESAPLTPVLTQVKMPMSEEEFAIKKPKKKKKKSKHKGQGQGQGQGQHQTHTQSHGQQHISKPHHARNHKVNISQEIGKLQEKEMSTHVKRISPDDSENWFVSLGGSGEIGTNLYLYGFNHKWLMVDFGISFGDDTTPGVDIVFPDISFIEAQKDKLVGLVVTHAHEDHLGAIPYLWQRLNCPIYCTPFTAAIIRAKMAESNVPLGNMLRIIPVDGEMQLEDFYVKFICMTHSIPEPSALLIETKAGRIVHTGDWRIDDEPIIGRKTDKDYLRKIGDEGVDVLICDSTNANVKSIPGSEQEVELTLGRIFAENQRRILVTCFASNIGRIVSITRAAFKHGKRVALVGRSLWRMTDAARETGYLENIPDYIHESDISNFKAEDLVLICTGSQGEKNAALSKISRGEHPSVRLKPDDLILFSSREIPGNEIQLNRIKNNLSEFGLKFMTSDDDMIHVSGHPAQDQLTELYSLVRPRISVPVHGEFMHQKAHAELAKSCGAQDVVIPANGDLLAFKGSKFHHVDKVYTGKYALQGDKIVRFNPRVINDRLKMISTGVVFVTLVLDKEGYVLSDPNITMTGIFDHEKLNLGEVDEVIYSQLEQMTDSQIAQDKLVHDMLYPKIRKYFLTKFGLKPTLKLHIARVS